MQGNLNADIAYHEGYQNLNSELTFENKPGSGWTAGGEFVYYINKTTGIQIGCNYIRAESKLNLKGSYAGYKGQNYNFKEVQYANSKLDYRGLEFSVGVIIKK